MMTKVDIADKLMILRESLKGQAKNHYRMADGEYNRDFGYAEACERYAERVDELYQKVKGDLK